MATGPEHYRAAEKLLADIKKVQASVRECMETGEGTVPVGLGNAVQRSIESMTAIADVHATLALAAATALMTTASGDWAAADQDREAWRRTASALPPFAPKDGA